ncbi:hypothetical protein [Mesoplasma melaleucae]|uniref:Uncharacterized protein n=1 Tax=Mesoplasma melaleucae TaxID=81459 RepID=A0A2K8NZH6_9MOLU|nr:hypothetical protein [Mesoplasma melaleucae]ATZ18033.1 hypothetical protein EMELA_v1c04930 [Mesoplasma melaleucae]
MDKNQKVTLLNNNENKIIKSKFAFFDNKIFLADSLWNKVEYFDKTSNTYVQLDIPNNKVKIKDMIVNNNKTIYLIWFFKISKLKISNSAVAKDTIISSNTNNFNKLISLNDQLLVSTLKGTSKLYKITSDKQTVSLSTDTFSSDIDLMYVAIIDYMLLQYN